MRNFKIALAENLVGLAKIIMPSNYMLEGERAIGHLAIAGVYDQAIEAGIKDGGEFSLYDIFKFYAEHHK